MRTRAKKLIDANSNDYRKVSVKTIVIEDFVKQTKKLLKSKRHIEVVFVNSFNQLRKRKITSTCKSYVKYYMYGADEYQDHYSKSCFTEGERVKSINELLKLMVKHDKDNRVYPITIIGVK